MSEPKQAGWFAIFFIVIIFIIIVSVGVITVVQMQKRWSEGKAMDDALKANNIPIVIGEIDSPSLILTVNSTEFLQLAITANIVYAEPGSFWIYYVFNPEMTIAYKNG